MNNDTEENVMNNQLDQPTLVEVNLVGPENNDNSPNIQQELSTSLF